MRRFDLGVFEPGDRTPDGTSDGERPRGNDIGDLVSLATFLGPESHHPDSAERAAVVIKQWAESDAALLADAETVAHRDHHEEAVEILRRARKLAMV